LLIHSGQQYSVTNNSVLTTKTVVVRNTQYNSVKQQFTMQLSSQKLPAILSQLKNFQHICGFKMF